MNLEECIKNLKKKNIIVYGTNVVNGVDLKTIKKTSSYAIAMGNEGKGKRPIFTLSVEPKNQYLPLYANNTKTPKPS